MSAMIDHAPNATARLRAMRSSLRHGDTVACKGCGEDMPAARAACAISHGLCVECNAPTLKDMDAARYDRASQDRHSRHGGRGKDYD